jgi:hypothetical protein
MLHKQQQQQQRSEFYKTEEIDLAQVLEDFYYYLKLMCRFHFSLYARRKTQGKLKHVSHSSRDNDDRMNVPLFALSLLYNYIFMLN